MNPAELCQDIIDWLRKGVLSSGGKGAIFGLSGGIDSALVAVLCKKAFDDQCLGLIMPCHSLDIDTEHALLLAREFEIPYMIVSLDGVFDQMLLSLGEKPEDVEKSLAAANIKPRLRMTALYYHAAKNGYRVIGTGNKSEIVIGYFTKYGDAAVDLEPIGDLLKEEVMEISAYLGIPRVITDKEPSGGLWEGQTDEDEIGFSYSELDRYLRGCSIDPAVQKKIVEMQQGSEHKRCMPPIFHKK
ncbi:MAG: NAD(+) synthase [Dethiobacteria bacterium]|jgi:NAD+ synthase